MVVKLIWLFIMMWMVLLVWWLCRFERVKYLVMMSWFVKVVLLCSSMGRMV